MKVRIRKADSVFSLYIRTKAGWRCERCGSKHEKGSTGLHASHYHGRRKESVRFSESNVSSICFGCHNFFHAHPEEHRKWMLNKLGEKEFNNLLVQANTPAKKDDQAVILVYKKLLADLEKS